MAKVWNPKIHEKAKKAWVQFKKWVSWNPKGRPVRWIRFVNEQMVKEWVLPATQSDIIWNYMSMVNLYAHELKAIVDAKDQPMLTRIIAKALLSGKWFDTLERILDRGIGKAVQKIEWDAPVNVQVILSKQETIYLEQAFTEDETPKV
jgi:hypothetical protein